MTILQLISQLKEFEQEHGNLDVVVEVENQRSNPVTVYEEDGEIVIADAIVTDL